MTSPPVFPAHGVPDLVALLPTRFGFVPKESLCAIATIGPRHRLGFSVRVDLPARMHLRAVSELVTGHLRRHGAEGAVLLAVSQRPRLAEEAVRLTEDSLAPVRPVVSAWATEDRYWTTFDDCDPRGYPYEPSPGHVVLAEAVAAGREILPDRETLVRRYLPEDSARRRWLAHTAPAVMADIARRTADGRRTMAALGREEVEPILDAALAGRPPSEGEVLRLALWTTCAPVRGLVWERIRRRPDQRMLALWAHVARLAPPGFEAGPLCLAGFAASVLGDGAQALVAVERALTVAPGDRLAEHLLERLVQGLPPRDAMRMPVPTP